MPVKIAVHTIEELAHKESENEFLLDALRNTRLHIVKMPNARKVIINFPFGNRFELIKGTLVIHER